MFIYFHLKIKTCHTILERRPNIKIPTSLWIITNSTIITMAFIFAVSAFLTSISKQRLCFKRGDEKHRFAGAM